MRKKPPGKLVSKPAHKVEREYRVLKALEQTEIPVPRTLRLCEDQSVIGTPFYIMEILDGHIFEDPTFHGVFCWGEDGIMARSNGYPGQVLPHQPGSIGLAGYGKLGGLYNRQLGTCRNLTTAQGAGLDTETKGPVGPVPRGEQMIRLFSDPKYQPNDLPRIIRILDWEMSTVGHPLADIANVVHPWTVNDNVNGLPSIPQCLAGYTSEAGRGPAPELSWAEAFCLFRLSASSTKAKERGKAMCPSAELTKQVIRDITPRSDVARL
ncbi:kinase-like domain-containing protein [Aspergillus falconensis]